MDNKPMKDTFNRLGYIDFLKFIGLTGILVAHVGSPSWAMMLRSFDVPLMVILSSILAHRSFSKNPSISHYYGARAKRLIFPTWIFLLFYFLLCYIFSGKAETLHYYIASFCLTRYGIGYVWIILIYLYSAMLIPLFDKIKFTAKGIVIVFFSYVLYEVAYYYRIGLDGGVSKAIIETTVYYIIPYGVLTFLGYNYQEFDKKTKGIIFFINLVVFVFLAIFYFHNTGKPQLVSISKYPPRLYYMSYGVTCSFGLLMLCEDHSYKLFDNKIIKYISAHSMWIYLWHIFIIEIYDYIKLPEIWFVKLIIVYFSSILVVLVTNRLYDCVEKRKRIKMIKYLRG